MAQELDLKKMKVSELKAQLEQRGQPTDGLKADLQNRLQACLDEEEFGLGEDGDVKTVATITTAITANTPHTSTISNAALAEPKKATEGNGDDTTKEKDAAATENSGEEKKTADSSADLSFEEKKRLRANRFSIPVVSTTKLTAEPKEKRQKVVKEVQAAKEKKEPLLSEEEVDKLLARASKYGGVDQTRLDELKAMKRKYRFMKGASGAVPT